MKIKSKFIKVESNYFWNLSKLNEFQNVLLLLKIKKTKQLKCVRIRRWNQIIRDNQ